MKHTTKLRVIALVETILIAAIMCSMAACGERLQEGSLSGNGSGGGDNNVVDNNVGDIIVNVYEDGRSTLVPFTITNLGDKTGSVGLTVACEGWNWTVEDFGVIQDGQVPVSLSVQHGNYHIVLWFEQENTYHVYTAGTNIAGINDALLFEITDNNIIHFDQFKVIPIPFHELTVTGFEYWFNNMQGWGIVFDGDAAIGWSYGTIANGSLNVTLRRLFNARTEAGPFRLKVHIWQGNYVYELSDFTIGNGGADNSSSVHISEFVSNYHKLTVTGLTALADREVSAAVYNDDDQLLNTQMGFGIISGNTGTFTLAGDFGWNAGVPLRLVLNIKGDLRMYELSDFTPVGNATAVAISQFKRNYHQLHFTGLADLLTGGLLYARRVFVSVYDANGLEAAHQSYFLQAQDNICSYILLGDFGWTEGSVSPHPFRLKLEFFGEELPELVYELSDFIPTGNSTNLDINQFTQK
ncbi:MAG: hypothetical protein FWD36_08650 [Treponema sp.]|nr:hypothetical protein [Treponema sp.]